METKHEQRILRQRYENAVRLADRWLQEHKRSQTWLADEIGVERSVLSRFLNPEAQDYKPESSRPRMLMILEGIERVCMGEKRDIFLSHSRRDKDVVRQLAADLESATFGDRHVLTWLDEAEIRPGQSIPGLINQGLETSRFVGVVMTPAYFEYGSGWTAAEWHAALHGDPDNHRARLLPLLVQDCPYVPPLLRHLLMIDLREDTYAQGLQQLLRVLREEPLPRPVTYRGELIQPSGRIDRVTLLAERAVPDADPDPIPEKLYCNLLPVDKLPRALYSAPLAPRLRQTRRGHTVSLPRKKDLIEIVRTSQEDAGIEAPRTPAFRVIGDRVISFHDLASAESPLAPIVDADACDEYDVRAFLTDEDERRIVISLINMAIDRHASRQGLAIDPTQGHRYFFPSDDGKPRVIPWRPLKKRAQRTVAKPYLRHGIADRWIHHACSMRVIFLAARLYIQLTPTRMLTEDGSRVIEGPAVGRIVSRWLNQERNLHVLYHIRFWTSVLRQGPGPISIRVGEQWMEVATTPAFVQQAYGIEGDRKDLLGLLDHEAPLIAQLEDQTDEPADLIEYMDEDDVIEQTSWDAETEEDDAR